MSRLGLLVVAGLLCVGASKAAAARTLVLDLELFDTSGEAPSPEHAMWLKRVSAELRRELDHAGYDVIDGDGAVQPGTEIRTCNGCENDIAKAAGADRVVFGVIHKVSSLILSVLLVVEDVRSDRAVATARADIRGDNERSWSRGVAWLARHRLAEHAPNPR